MDNLSFKAVLAYKYIFSTTGITVKEEVTGDTPDATVYTVYIDGTESQKYTASNFEKWLEAYAEERLAEDSVAFLDDALGLHHHMTEKLAKAIIENC